MKTTVVIVTYNKKDDLSKSLKKIFNIDGGIYRVVVINNNSSDGTAEYLKSVTDDRLIYKNLSENLGGAGGFSKGIKIAYEETDADYFWIIDDDAIADSNALKALVGTAQKLNNHFGFLSSSVRYENGDGANCPRTINGAWNLDLNRFGLIRVKDATFVSLFIKRSTVKKVGLPIREMFIWGDDQEYTSRINTSTSYGSYFVMNSNVTHMSKNLSTDIYSCPMKLLPRYKCVYRNFLYTDIHYSSASTALKTIVRNLCISIKTLFASKNHRLKRFSIVIVGTINGLLFAPKIQFPREKND